MNRSARAFRFLQMAVCAAAVACLTTSIDASRAPKQDATAQKVDGPLAECSVAKSTPRKQPDEGEITLADIHTQRYESVSPYLDGLLRDLEAVSLADLTNLDASAPTNAAISFLQTVFSAEAKYDQAAGINNRRKLANDEQQSAINSLKNESDAALLRQWLQQRDLLTSQLIASTNEVNQLALLEAAKTISPDDQKSLDQARARKAAAEAGLATAKAQIDSLSAPKVADLSLTSVTAEKPAAPSFTALGDLLKALPADAKNNLNATLASPSYPAVKKIDDFVTLLHDRLAREVSVLEDDVLRAPDTLTFLVQFDVGLLPSSDAKNRVGRVEFTIPDCPKCRVYALYPGAASSYNTVSYDAATRTTGLGFVGSFLSWGLNIHFDRRRDTVASALMPSLYVAGFNDSATAAKRFGWLYGAAPGRRIIDTGTRSTYAVISMPRSSVREFQSARKAGRTDDACLRLKMTADWPDLKDPEPPARRATADDVLVRLPATAGLTEPLPRLVTEEPNLVHVRSIEYNPVYLQDGAPAPSTEPSASCQPNTCAAIVIALDRGIHPELVVTVRGQLLRRIRDWRGRATALLPPAQGPQDPKSRNQNAETRSLLELDKVAPNTWYALDERRLLLTISRSLAGDDEFPVIQIIDPTKRTVVIPHDLDQGTTEVITNGFHMIHRDSEQLRRYLESLKAEPGKGFKLYRSTPDEARIGPYAPSTFLPLFNPHTRPAVVHAVLGETGRQIVIGFERYLPSGSNQDQLHFNAARTQVVLEDDQLDFAWSLLCSPQGPTLICDLPTQELTEVYSAVKQNCGDCRMWWARGEASAAAASLLFDRFLVPSLQVWVSQYDPEGHDAFYTPTPARLGLFPIDPTPVANERPRFQWRLGEVAGATAKLVSCNYFPKKLVGKSLSLLGERFAATSPALTVQQDGTDCLSLDVPAEFLATSQLILNGDKDILPAPMVVDLGDLKPAFSQPKVRPGVVINKRPGDRWTVTYTVSRVGCNDTIELPSGGLSATWTAEIDTETKSAGTLAALCSVVGNRFSALVRQNGLSYVLNVPKAALTELPDTLLIKRAGMTLASVDPNAAILPSSLSALPLENNHFMLRGKNVAALDRVIVNNGSVSGEADLAVNRTGSVFIAQRRAKKAKPSDPDKFEPLPPGIYTVTGVVGSGKTSRIVDLVDRDKPLTITIPEPPKKEKPEEKPKTACAPFVVCCAGCPPAAAAAAAAATPPKVIKK